MKGEHLRWPHKLRNVSYAYLGIFAEEPSELVEGGGVVKNCNTSVAVLFSHQDLVWHWEKCHIIKSNLKNYYSEALISQTNTFQIIQLYDIIIAFGRNAEQTPSLSLLSAPQTGGHSWKSIYCFLLASFLSLFHVTLHWEQGGSEHRKLFPKSDALSKFYYKCRFVQNVALIKSLGNSTINAESYVSVHLWQISNQINYYSQLIYSSWLTAGVLTHLLLSIAKITIRELSLVSQNAFTHYIPRSQKFKFQKWINVSVCIKKIQQSIF